MAETLELPNFTAGEIPDVIGHADFQAAPPEKRAEMLDHMLATAHADLSAQGEWTMTNQQNWRAFADDMRSRVAPSAGERVAGVGRGVRDMGVGLLQQGALAGMAVADKLGGAVGLPRSGLAQQYGERFDNEVARRFAQAGEVLQTKLAQNQTPFGEPLSALRNQIDSGAVPFDSPEATSAWIDRHARTLEPALTQWYNDNAGTLADPVRNAEEAKRNGLNNPRNRAALERYIITGNPDAWSELERQMQKTPDRLRADRDEEAFLASAPARAMQSMGLAPHNLTQAADPVQLAMMAAGAGLAKQAVKAGTLAQIGQRAAHGAAEMGAFGAGATLLEHPQADTLDVAKGAGEMAVVGGLFAGGIGALGAGVKTLRGKPNPGPEVPPPNRQSAPNVAPKPETPRAAEVPKAPAPGDNLGDMAREFEALTSEPAAAPPPEVSASVSTPPGTMTGGPRIDQPAPAAETASGETAGVAGSTPATGAPLLPPAEESSATALDPAPKPEPLIVPPDAPAPAPETPPAAEPAAPAVEGGGPTSDPSGTVSPGAEAPMPEAPAPESTPTGVEPPSGESAASPSSPDYPRAPGSPQAGFEGAAGIRNKLTDAEREARGLPRIAPPVRQGFAQWWQAAQERLDENPMAGADLVQDLKNQPRAPSPVENALLSQRKLDIEAAHQRGVDAFNAAADEPARAEARREMQRTLDSLDEFDQVAKSIAGTEAGRALQSRQLLLGGADFYKLPAMMARERAYRGGRELTDAEVADVQARHAKIEEARAALEAHDNQASVERAGDAMEELHAEAAAEIADAEVKIEEEAKPALVKTLNDAAAAARARLEARRNSGRVSMNPVGDVLATVMDHAIIAISRGVEFSVWAKDMVQQFGEDVREHLKDLWDRARSARMADSPDQAAQTHSSSPGGLSEADSIRDVGKKVAATLENRKSERVSPDSFTFAFESSDDPAFDGDGYYYPKWRAKHPDDAYLERFVPLPSIGRGENGKFYVGESYTAHDTLDQAKEAVRKGVADYLEENNTGFKSNIDGQRAASEVFDQTHSYFAPYARRQGDGWGGSKWGSWYFEATGHDGEKLKLSIRDHEATRKDLGLPDKSWEVSKNWDPEEVADRLAKAYQWLSSHAKRNLAAISDSEAWNQDQSPEGASMGATINADSSSPLNGLARVAKRQRQDFAPVKATVNPSFNSTAPESGAMGRMEAAAAAARARLEARRNAGRVSMNPVGDVLATTADHAIIGAYHLANGAVKFADWAGKMVAEFGESIRPHLQDLFKTSKDYLDQTAKDVTKAVRKRRAPKTPEQVVSSATTAGGGAVTHAVVRELAKAHLKISGTKQTLGQLLARIHADVQRIDPSMTLRQVQDLLPPPKRGPRTKTELQKALRENQAQALLASRIEDAQKGIPPEKRVTPEKMSDKVREMWRTLRDVMREKFGISTDPAKQLATARDAVVSRLKNQLRDLDLQLRGKQKPRAARPPLTYDKEMLDLKKQRDELQAYLDDLTGPSAAGKWNARAEAAAKASAEYYRRKVALGDLERKNARGPAHEATARTKAAQADAEAAKAEWEDLREAAGLPQAEKVAAMKRDLAKRMADLRAKIAGKAPPPKAPGAKVPMDAEGRAMQAEMARLQAVWDEMHPRKPLSDAEQADRAEKRIDKQVAEIERELATGERKARKDPSWTPDARTRALQAELESLRSARDAAREAKRPKLSPEALALRQFKRRMAAESAKLQERARTGDVSPRKKPARKIAMDDEATAAQARYNRLLEAEQRRMAEHRWLQRPKWQRVLDRATLINRGWMVLSGIRTLAKLSSAVAENMVVYPAAEAVGGALGKVLPEAFTSMARREGRISLRAEREAVVQGFLNGLREFGTIVKTGRSELDALHGKPSQSELLAPHWTEYFGRLHAAMKNPMKRAEYVRSAIKRLELAEREGANIKDPSVQMQARNAAYLDALDAVLMGDSKLVGRWNMFRRSLENAESPSLFVLAKAMELFLPVIKVPTNYVKASGRAVFGLPVGSARLGYHLATGLAHLTPEKADAIMKQLKMGSIGGAFALLGFFNPDMAGGYYQDDERRKSGDVGRGSIRVGGVTIPHLIAHNPVLEAMQFGATVARVMDGTNYAGIHHSTVNHTASVPAAVMAAGSGLAREVPLLETPWRVHDMVTNWGPAGDRVRAYALPNFVVPGAVRDIAAGIDMIQGVPDRNAKAGGNLGPLMKALPGLRQTLPPQEAKH